MTIPSFLLLLGLNANYVRFVLPLFPPLMLIAGKATADLIAARAAYLRLAGATVATVVIVVSALYAVVVDLEMTNDLRAIALDWVEQNVPQGARIEVTSYVARPSGDRYQVVPRPFVHSVSLDNWIERLEGSPIYRALQPIYLVYKSIAEGIDICADRPYHYRGWYDRIMAKQISAFETFDFSVAGLETRAPDLLIVSEFYYGRYGEDRSSVEGNFFADLFAGKSSYRQVAEFRYQALPWPDPRVDFINPTIRIFQKADHVGPARGRAAR